MATLTVTIPDSLVPTFVTIAKSALWPDGVFPTPLPTNAQIGQMLIAKYLKDVYMQYTVNNAAASVQSTIDTAKTNAKTTVGGIA